MPNIAFLSELVFGEGVELAGGDDDVVCEGDFNGGEGTADDVCLADIGLGGLGCAAGVVVHHDHVAGLLFNGTAENLSRVYHRALQAS